MQQITVAATLVLALVVSVTQGAKVLDTGLGKVFKLKVEQDVFVESPTVNHNKDKWLVVAKHPGFPTKRTLLKFEDLSNKCPVHHIKWAKMYLYFDGAHRNKKFRKTHAPSITRYLALHVMKKAWNEAQATTKYRVTGTPWSFMGIGIDSTDAEPCAQCGTVAILPGRPEGFVEFDITGAIQSWAQGVPNYGVILRAINELEAGQDLRFFSKEEKDKKKHAFVHVFCSP